MRLLPICLIATLGIAACEHTKTAPAAPSTKFFENLRQLCNSDAAFGGKLVSTDAVDADFAGKTLLAGPATCPTADEVRVPFAVDEDRSRTWVITRQDAALRLKHDHRHKDGTEDILTQYGGDSLTLGTLMRQEFPVDAETRALFTQEKIEVSNQNTWAVEITPGEQFSYEMSRPNRFFRIEFDLDTPLKAPPKPWGVEPIE